MLNDVDVKRYMSLLFFSCSSVCLSFSRILKWGERPVISSFLSFKFLKIFLLIFTTLFLVAARMATIVKSLMLYTIVQSNEDLNSGEMGEIFSKHFRGIAKGPEVMTFFTATVTASICSMILMFGASFTMILIFSFKFYGWKTWIVNITDEIVLFVFPLVTNFSFYQEFDKVESVPESQVERGFPMFERRRVSRTTSLPQLNTETENKNTPEIQDIESTKKQKRNPCFSKKQSIILYCIFLFNYLIVLSLDITVQLLRKTHVPMHYKVSYVTKNTASVLVFNIFLWCDFITEVDHA